MAKYVIARQMGGKTVVTTSGEIVGRVYDVEMSKNGKLISLTVEADAESKAEFPKDMSGRFVIPYDSVNAVSKLVVVKG